jgi:hypothetical protein
MRKLASTLCLVMLLTLGLASSPASAHGGGGWGLGGGGWGHGGGGWGHGGGGWGHGGWGHGGWGWGHGWGWRGWGGGWGWGWGWPGWGPGYWGYGWAPYAGYPAYGAYTPPVAPDEHYVERAPEPSYADSEPAAPPVQGYWYYCQSRHGYYPKVRSCPEQWVKVPPRPE